MSSDNEADLMLDQLHLPRRKRSGTFSTARPISFDQARSAASNNKHSATLHQPASLHACQPACLLNR